MKEDLIKTIIKYNCGVLKVQTPNIKFVPAAEMATPTTMAAVSSTGDEILLNKELYSIKEEFRLYLILSHECRHLWQIKYCSDDYLHGYHQSNEIDVKAYNEQSAEVDAWAWAIIATYFATGISVSLAKDLGDDAQRQILARVNEILEAL